MFGGDREASAPYTVHTEPNLVEMVYFFSFTHPRQFSQSGVHLLVTAGSSTVDVTVIPAHTYTYRLVVLHNVTVQ